MALAAIHSKTVVLLLLVHCLMLLQYALGICFRSCFCNIVICAPYSFAIISLNKKEFVASIKLYSYFNVCIFVCVLVSLPHGVMSWFAINACDIYLSYSYSFGNVKNSRELFI